MMIRWPDKAGNLPLKRLLKGLPRWQRNRKLALRLCKTEHFLSGGIFLQWIVQLTEIQPSQPLLPLERRSAHPKTGKPVRLERKMIGKKLQLAEP